MRLSRTLKRAGALSTAVLLALLAGGCSDMCANDEIDRLPSPGGEYEAVLFQRACGATSGFSTQVSIVPAGAELDGTGNAFVADDDHGEARTGDWGGPWAEVRWQSPRELLVRYAAGSGIFTQRPAVSGVAVQFEAVERPADDQT